MAMPDRNSAFYVLPLILDLEKLRVGRQEIHAALVAEGITGISLGYTNLHLLPMFQEKIAYGTKGFPWVPGIAHREIDYSLGICPIAEELHASSFMGFEVCKFNLSENEVDLIVEAFRKVFDFYVLG